MCHPPLLASNCFLFYLCAKRDLFHLVAIATFWCTAQNTFVWRLFCALQLKCHISNIARFSGTHTKGDRISYPCWQIGIWSWGLSSLPHERSVPAFIHMIVQCALRCCATCIGTVLNKCWIEAIVLLSSPIKWTEMLPTQICCLFLCCNKLCISPLYIDGSTWCCCAHSAMQLFKLFVILMPLVK